MYGAESWKLRNLDQKYVESFEMWCWRRMEKIIWTDRVRNEEVLHKSQEERNILYRILRRLTRLVACGVGTVFYNTILKERYWEGWK